MFRVEKPWEVHMYGPIAFVWYYSYSHNCMNWCFLDSMYIIVGFHLSWFQYSCCRRALQSFYCSLYFILYFISHTCLAATASFRFKASSYTRNQLTWNMNFLGNTKPSLCSPIPPIPSTSWSKKEWGLPSQMLRQAVIE